MALLFNITPNKPTDPTTDHPVSIVTDRARPLAYKDGKPIDIVQFITSLIDKMGWDRNKFAVDCIYGHLCLVVANHVNSCVVLEGNYAYLIKLVMDEIQFHYDFWQH